MKYIVATVESKELWSEPLECDNYYADSNGNLHFYNYEAHYEGTRQVHVRSVASYVWGAVHEV